MRGRMVGTRGVDADVAFCDVIGLVGRRELLLLPKVSAPLERKDYYYVIANVSGLWLFCCEF